jgi:hypothetical protein
MPRSRSAASLAGPLMHGSLTCCVRSADSTLMEASVDRALTTAAVSPVPPVAASGPPGALLDSDPGPLPPPRGRRSGGGYLQARLQLVRQEYARVRGILTLTQKDSRQRAEWQQAAELLKEAGASLTARFPDARAAAATIAHADQSLVWCSDIFILRGRARLLVDELDSLGLNSKQLYESAFLQAAGQCQRL